MKTSHLLQRGQSLIELLLAIGLLSVLLPILVTGLMTQKNGTPQLEQRQEAIALVREGQEAARVYREADWTAFANLDVSKSYYPVSGSTWTLAQITLPGETINGFTRVITISNVSRDASGNIASTGTIDPSTKKVTTTVSWNTPRATSVSASEYLTRNTNQSYTETTVPQFNAGTKASVVVQATTPPAVTNDGEVVLGPGATNGDWCNPSSGVIATHNFKLNGVPEAIAAFSPTDPSATQDLTYATTGINSSGNNFTEVTISHTTPPITPTFADPYSINDNGAKSYGIYADSNYAYYAGNTPQTHTVTIVHADNLSKAGYFDVPGKNITGYSVYVSGPTGYVTDKNASTLYSFDLTTIKGTSTSQSQKGSVGLAGTGNRVFVVGTNAYVATADTSNQLQVINASDPTHMSVAKSIKLGSGAGIDIYVDSSQKYAYVTTDAASGSNNFYVVDLNNTSNIHAYTTTTGILHPKGIILPVSNRAIIVGSGSGGQLYQVFRNDDTNLDPSKWNYCGGMSPAGVTSINAVAGVTQNTGNVYSYIVTDNTSAELQVVQGGPGGTNGIYTTGGTFTSQILPLTLTTNVAFNNFIANVHQSPPTTIIKLQVAVSGLVGGTCPTSIASYTFVGPDSTTSTYFTSTSNRIIGAIPLTSFGNYQNPGRCVRYQATLSTTDTNQTPTLEDITFNYSP